MKKRVLVVAYSQAGQLADVVRAVTAPLQTSNSIEVVFEWLQPQTPYPFPWPFLQFFNTFPETVHERPAPLHPLQVSTKENFDLVILAYSVWFLSPAQPMMAFLQSEQAANLLRDKPVITLIACRNMWLMAQEVKTRQLGRAFDRQYCFGGSCASSRDIYFYTAVDVDRQARPVSRRPCAGSGYSFG